MELRRRRRADAGARAGLTRDSSTLEREHAPRSVSYRRRVGVSKVTGTLSGTVKASATILYTIARYALEKR